MSLHYLHQPAMCLAWVLEHCFFAADSVVVLVVERQFVFPFLLQSHSSHNDSHMQNESPPQVPEATFDWQQSESGSWC